MKIEILPVGAYAANCYIVYYEDTKEAIVIDPGEEGDRILRRIEELKLEVKYIFLTHGHIDHISGLPEVKEGINAPILMHEADRGLLSEGNVNLSVDKFIQDGEKFKFGNDFIEIIHTPGHTQGGISIRIGDNLFTGDTLFAGSIGRTDFPGGSYEQIIKSIKEKLVPYPDNTIVYSGHGPSSTMGREKEHNPFIIG